MTSRLSFCNRTLTGVTTLVALGVSSQADAATPTYWDNRADFEASLTGMDNDDFEDPGYPACYNSYTDAQWNAVRNETIFEQTQYVDFDYLYCYSDGLGFDTQLAGYGSVLLTFTSHTFGDEEGVNAVGVDIFYSSAGFPVIYAYITYADGTTDAQELPIWNYTPPGAFWGVSAPEKIESIHLGSSVDGSVGTGYVYWDNLTVGRQLCGNGVLDTDVGEECDEGDETATCDSNCTFVSCGDGDSNQAAGEDCDTAGDSINCDFDCTFVVCGDAYINSEALELCDDGSPEESATCDLDCTAAECGDATYNLTAGEQCDDGEDSVDCNFDCTLSVCGDGYLNEVDDEICDEAGDSKACDGDCTLVECGDGYLNTAINEICDDAKGSATCDPDCTAPECGDGLFNSLAGEECDGDGMGTPGETPVCDSDCTEAKCGDGVVNMARDEECDDGNGSDGDGCASFCIIEEGGSSGGSGSSGESGSSEDSSTPESSSGAEETGSTTSPVETTSLTTTGVTTETDGDTSPSAGDDGGCGCSTQNGKGSVLALFLLTLGLVRRRRHSTPIAL